MKLTNTQVTLNISKKEKDIISDLYDNAVDIGLNFSGIGDLIAAIWSGAESENCRISSIDSVEVAIKYDN